ncbi:MAG: esterase-like activity of phytase family protein [Solidesulfovibrio sp. DCME]|uniref:esterase-like activity of phytase family protein n=1 Tax=Solidesulfovibrio sp. DCME TaxID=3447380 RepID=UPI003D0F10CD
MPVRVCLAGLALLLATATALADQGPKIEKYVLEAPKETNIAAPAALAKAFPEGFPQGLGSGVAYAGTAPDGATLLFVVGDRGPNADAPDFVAAPGAKPAPAKFFPAPDYAPTLATVRIKDGKASVTALKPLRDAAGKPLSGRPLPPGAVGSTGETPLAADRGVLPLDAAGLDTEGLVVSPTDGSLWLCDEYGPFLVNVDPATGKVLRKFGPGQGLPDILAKRQPNRGFEGVAATTDGKVVAAVQSILDTDGKVKSSKAPFTRLVELDPATGKTRMFAYPIDVDAYKKAADAKIGDLVALSPTRLLIVEQGKGADKQMRNRVYAVDLSEATDLTGKAAPDGAPLESLADAAALAQQGITMARKSLVLDLRQHGWTAEKAEGLAVSPDGKTLFLTSDNDFGLAVTPVNPAAGKDGKPVTDPTDYRMSPDGKLSLDGQEVATTFSIQPSGEKTTLWVVTLAEPLR